MAEKEKEHPPVYMRMLFETMDEAFAVKEMITDSDGRIDFRFIEVNPAFEKQCGLRDVVGKTMRQLMPGIQDPLVEKFASVIRTGDHIRYQDYVAGLNRWFDILAWPLGSPQDLRIAVLFTDVTERKRSEEALKESEERFRIMADGLPLVVWVHDAKGRQQFVNRRFLEFFALKPEEVKRVRWHTLLHPDDSEAYTRNFRACLAGRTPFHAEVRARRGDGQWRWIESWGTPRWSASGEFLGFVGTSADVTERKHMERALQKANQTYELVLAGSEAGIWDWDLIRNRVVYSSRWKALRGFEEKEIGDSLEEWSKSLHPEDYDRVMASLKEHFDGKTSIFAEEYRVRRKDGSWMWIADRGLCRRDETGRVTQMAGSETDITERKQYEKSLHESRMEQLRQRQFLQMLLDHAQACIAVMQGRELRYTLVNRAYQALRPDLEMIGRTFREVFPDAISAGAEALVRAVLTTGESREDHGYPLPIPGKPDAAWNQQMVRLPMVAGEEPSVLMITWDATEHKRAKDALQLLNETLEQQVSERALLAETRTKQLQALAVELIEAEEQERRRIATLLHDDLQQLLAAARFTLQATAHLDPVLVEVQRVLEDAIRKSRHLSHELSPAVLHQSGLYAALEWLCLHMREHFGLAVQLKTETNRQVQSRSLKVFLFRAVQELLFNIVKHAGVKSADVRFGVSEEDFIITVTDPGKGFDTSILDKYAPKAGLGLLSIRERARYIGGSLTIESGPGLGCRLTLRIPVKMDQDLQPESEALDVEEKKRIPADTIKKVEELGIRVLFADDHKVMRQGLIRLLSGKPNILVVGEASNGLQALELSRQLRPDVVVMDVSMPEMDGIEATRRIKAELPDVRVVGLSMHEDEHISRTMREAGAEAFVNKTASSAELLNAIYGTACRKQAAEAIP